MAKKRKTRNPLAGVLALPCFKKRVVRNKKAYSRKENTRAVMNTFRDGSFLYVKTAWLEATLFFKVLLYIVLVATRCAGHCEVLLVSSILPLFLIC